MKNDRKDNENDLPLKISTANLMGFNSSFLILNIIWGERL